MATLDTTVTPGDKTSQPFDILSSCNRQMQGRVLTTKRMGFNFALAKPWKQLIHHSVHRPGTNKPVDKNYKRVAAPFPIQNHRICIVVCWRLAMIFALMVHTGP